MTRKRLLVATEADGSGLGRFAVELANALETAGQPVTFVARAQPGALQVTARITVPPLAAGSGWRKWLALTRQSLSIAGAVWRDAGPACPLLLIHIAPTVPVSLAPMLAARLRGARIALSLHDFYPHTPRFPGVLRGLERWLYRMAYRRCDLIVTNTAAQTGRLVSEAKIAPNRVRTLYHGPFILPPLAPNDDSPDLRLLVFGSLRPNKRVLEAIRAVVLLRAQGFPIRLRIAGAARREDGDYWPRCLAELPAGDPAFDVQARFIAEAELADMLSGIDALLCPYAGFDSQSGVVITGVSNAVPVIGTAAAGAGPVDLAGAPWPLVSERADAVAIAEAIRAFMSVPTAARRAFATDCQRRFLATAGWDNLAANYIAAMRELLFW